MSIKKNKESFRIMFAGTPDFSARHLDALLKSPHKIVAVLTQPDRPSGRGNKLTLSAVKLLAQKHHLTVFQPETLKTLENQQYIAKLNLDLIVVVAYGLILPKSILTLPKLGCINVHGSLLPRWRGAAPIQRACLAGDKKTGITIIQMDEGLDTGDILYQNHCIISPHDTSASLYDKLAILGQQALIDTLADFSNLSINARPQDHTQATYATKLSKSEAKLNWQLPAVQLNRSVHAFNPWPVSYFEMEGHIIKVWCSSAVPDKNKSAQPPGTIVGTNKHGIAIMTSDGVLVITKLQLSGKKIMSAQELLNSKRAWFVEGKQLN